MNALVLILAVLPQSLTLDEALELSHKNQPSLRQAAASSDAARARTTQALAPLLPTVSTSIGYQRATANFAGQAGSVPSGVDTTSSVNLSSYDYFTGSMRVSATLWDFGQSWNRYQASISSADAAVASEASAKRTSDANVRSLFFAAASQQELVQVAENALANSEAHLDQIDGMVKAGARPQIDLAQARADVANARLTLVNAKNAVAVARAQLNQAMGVEGPTTFEVIGGSSASEVSGETKDTDSLIDDALASRPEVRALASQLQSQEQTVRATRGAYFPTLGVSAGGTLAARSLPNIVPNLNAQVTLNWNIFEGGATVGKEREGEATLRSLEAQRDGLRLQVRLELEQALLGVSSAKQGVSVAEEAKSAALEKLHLAEGRYQAGAGSVLELSDAQVTATQASAQLVQAKYALSTARTALTAALGG